MAYTTEAKVEAFLGKDLSAISGEVTAWIASAKAFIDKYCGRTFEAATETRYYDGNGANRITIEPFIGTPSEVALLNLDGSVQYDLQYGDGKDYMTYPMNWTEKNEIVILPNSPIRRFSRAYFTDILDDDETHDPAFTQRRILKVTAQFGATATCPPDVELVATRLVAATALTRLHGTTSGISMEALGDYQIRFKESTGDDALFMDITRILDTWREPSL